MGTGNIFDAQLSIEVAVGRWCYCSKVLPGKTGQVRDHWKSKTTQPDIYTQKDEDAFWDHLGMTGFDSWLQSTPDGDFIIHCLEGNSFKQIFKGLREQIEAKNPIALKLQKFYLEVLGKDYRLSDVKPLIESSVDISLPTSSDYIKRAFLYPLSLNKEEKHRHFGQEAMSNKKKRHEAMMRAFGVSHLSTWLQTTSHGKYIVAYTERHIDTPQNATSRLKQGQDSTEWREIASELSDHTGLTTDKLSPDVEWLTQPL